MSRTPVTGLLLAAGAGHRFGGPKALASLDGELLVTRGVRVLREGGCRPLIVVLGAQAERVREQARFAADVVVVDNQEWSQGIGSSLRAGLHVAAGAEAQRVLVALVDQVLVTSEVVRRIATASADRPAVVAGYAGRPRNPVRLDASVWPDVIAAAVGDVGARAWLRRHPECVHLVDCDDIGSCFDLDSASDLDRLVEERR